MYFNSLNPNLLLGYHGCDEEVGKKLLDGEQFLISKNDYDWLGEGIYFWENNPERALAYAHEKMNRGAIKKPFVVGACLTLGKCIDTISQEGILGLQLAYKRLEQTLGIKGITLPTNTKNFKKLDYAVVMMLHTMIKKERPNGVKEVDSVRALYYEGDPIYPGGSFYSKTHAQICVRSPDCIKAVFNPSKQVSLIPL